MKRVYLLYCLSGFVTLGYQVVWFRVFDDRFGVSNLTFALVVCGFVGGLGAGALASRRLTAWLARRLRCNDQLRVYGVIELLVSAAVLLTVAARTIPADAWGSFPYVQRGPMYEPVWWYAWSKVAIAAVCVVTPCFLMGTTYPLLCDAFRARSVEAPNDDAQPDGDMERRRRFPAALYAWNTAGACAGVVVCQFVLLRWIGHDNILWLMVAVNALIGLYFVMRGRAVERTDAPERSHEESSRTVAARKEPAETDESNVHLLLTCAILAGVLTGALEGDALKRIWFLGGTSGAAMAFVSFWAILAIFLGSWLVRAWGGMRLIHVKIAFVLAAACYAATWHFAYPIRAWLGAADIAAVLESIPEDQRTGTISVRFQSSLGQVFVFVGIFVFPAMLLLSTLLPFVCNRLHAAGRHVGVAYGLNTLAFCCGLIGFTLLAPRVNIFYSMKLFFVLLALGVVVMTMLRADRKPGWWLAAGGAVFGLACVITPADFDADYVLPHSPPAQYQVAVLRSNGAHTTYVVNEPAGARLYFDNHPMSGTARPAQTYMRLMAHFPLLAHEQPRTALLIGFGVGNTASAIAAHSDIERIDVVELNDQVIATAPVFANSHQEVHRDPRVRFIHDDGRNFLRLTDARYDLITSEPPPPMQAGVHRLYSRQYYAQARRRLTPRGLMTQWLPAYQMPPRAVEQAVRTFIDVFPHSLLFVGHGREFILVGGVSPIDLRRLEQRFNDDPRVTADLRSIGVTEPVALLARIVKTEAQLRAEFAGGRVIDDQRNDLAFLFANPAKLTTISYDPRGVLAEIDTTRLAAGPRLTEVLTHMGRLRYHVPDFPAASLATVPRDTDVALAQVNWRRVDALRRQAARAEAAGDTRRAVAHLDAALKIHPEQPLILLDVARLTFNVQQFSVALAAIDQLLEMSPHDVTANHARAQTLAAMKQFDAALKAARQCVRLAPHRAEFHIQLGEILAELDRVEEAIDAYDRAIEIEPDDPGAIERRAELRQRLSADDGPPPTSNVKPQPR